MDKTNHAVTEQITNTEQSYYLCNYKQQNKQKNNCNSLLYIAVKIEET